MNLAIMGLHEDRTLPDVVSWNYSETMKTIGIRELKANLSRVLRDVSSGTAFLVTDRGRVIAELRRPGMSDPSSVSEVDGAIAQLAAAGLLRVAERRQPSYKPSPIKSKKGLAKALLHADRAK